MCVVYLQALGESVDVQLTRASGRMTAASADCLSMEDVVVMAIDSSKSLSHTYPYNTLRIVNIHVAYPNS